MSALLLTGLLFSALPMAAQAQYFSADAVPDVFDDQTTSGVVLLGRPDGVLGPYANTSYFGPYIHLQHIAGDGPGYRDNGYTTLGLFAPMHSGPGILFSEGRLSVNDFGDMLGSVGTGYRIYRPILNRTFGGSVWYDVDGGHNGTFSQVGASLETRGQNWDMFANFYLPVGDDDLRFDRTVTPTGAQTLAFSGQFLALNRPNFISERFESAMRGLDVEFGGPLPVVGRHGIRGYGGWYHFNKEGTTDVNGGKFRLQAELTDSLQGQFTLTHDNEFDTSVIFSIAWTLPGSGAARGPYSGPSNRSGRTFIRAQSPEDVGDYDSQYHRLFQPTQRSTRVFVTRNARQTLQDNVTVLTNPATGQPIIVLHMDSRAAMGGNGSFEMPFNNPQEAEAGSNPGAIIFTHAGSVFDNAGNNFIALQQNQQLIGEGIPVFVTTQEAGAVTLPPSGDAGGFPTILGGPGGPQMANIVLANGSRVAGFNILNSGNAAILANNMLTGTANIESTTITGANIGLNVQGATGTVNFDAASSINNTLAQAVNVMGGTSVLNINGPINNSMGQSLNVNMLGAGGAVNLNGQLTDNGGTGISIQNSVGNVFIDDADLIIPNGNAVTLNNNMGIYRFEALDITTMNGGGLIATNSGTVQVGGGNINATGGPAIDIDPTAVNLRFNNVSSTNSPTRGIRLDQATGLIAITGTTTIASPAGRGIEINNSMVDVSIANANIDNTGQSAIFLQGSSGTFNLGTGLIGRTADGSDTIFINGGNMNVDVGANINHGVAVVNNNALVNIMNTTAGSANFTGTLVANDGTGIQINNADSNASFLGTTTLNGGDAGIDILGDSDGIFNFNANTSITNPTGIAFNVNGSGANNPRITYTGTIANNANRVISIANTAFGPDMITFNSTVANAITDTGTGIQLTNVGQTVNFFADTELTGTDGVEIFGGSGAFTFTDTDVNVMGTAFGINNGGGGASTASVNFQNGSTITQTTNNSTVTVANHAAGLVQFNGAIIATHGDGLQFNNADGIYNFNNFVSLNGSLAGGDTGIDIVGGSTGTFSFFFTNTTNPTGTAVNVMNSGPTADFGFGTITKTNAGTAVNVTGSTGGMLTFNGLVNASGPATGINIMGAMGDTTVAFNSTVTLGTMAAPLTGGTAVNINNNLTNSAISFADLNIFTTMGQEGLIAANGGSLAATGGDITTNGGRGISLDGLDANVSLGNVTVNGAGNVANDALAFNNLTGTVTIRDDVTVTNMGGSGVDEGISITGGSAVYSISSGFFDAVNISGVSGFGIEINGISGPADFGDTTIVTAGTDAINISNTMTTMFPMSNGDVTFDSTTLSGFTANGINLINNTGDFITNGGTIMTPAGGTGIMANYNLPLFGRVRGDITIANVTIDGAAAGSLAGINIMAAGTQNTPFQVLIDSVNIGQGGANDPIDGIVLNNMGAGRMDVTIISSIVDATINGLNATTAMGSTLQLNIGTTDTAGQTNTGLGNNIQGAGGFSYLFTNDGDINLGVSGTITAATGVDIPDLTIDNELNVFGNNIDGAAIMDADVSRMGANLIDAVNPNTIPVP